jgi:hypothetical protein
MSHPRLTGWLVVCLMSSVACERTVDAPQGLPQPLTPPADQAAAAPQDGPPAEPSPPAESSPPPAAGAAEIDALLGGGPALGELPLRATAEGVDFNPRLRSKLSPSVQVRHKPPGPIFMDGI